MHLKLILPTEILVDQPIRKLIAEAENGFFCLLPRHIDLFTILVPGILSFIDLEEQEQLLAVGEGVLIKYGQEVRVSTRQAIAGKDLLTLQALVEDEFRQLDDQERQTRSALAKLESSFARLFLELKP